LLERQSSFTQGASPAYSLRPFSWTPRICYA